MKKLKCGVWPTPLILTLRRQRQANVYEFEANLIYIARFIPGLQNEILSQKNQTSTQIMQFAQQHGK